MDSRRRRIAGITAAAIAAGAGSAFYGAARLMERGRADTIVAAAFLVAATAVFATAVNIRKIKSINREKK